ncbi:hypothetical protein SAMN04487904_10496 [Actinopolyspora lacussalsi subsp. righensis]|uniref:Secreted protein n=1 Tax=Actinopolyspora righensis TaxID=995060 RepID=A0A1I6Z9V7_9ACTN|nr:hypothetical protein [Actinopolyspora righensis]SFT59211.1 hypothetical protein SAMN04487904_10496 [Actinopolyspora righensis]
MRNTVRLAVLGVSGLVALSTGVAVAVTGNDIATESVAAGSPPPIVEDYSYPGADRIEQQRGIKLIEGDGNIVLADCAASDELIEVYSRNTETSCYRVIGNTGYLKVEIPEVYTLKGDDHAVEATVTVEGQTEVVDVAENSFTPVGEGENTESGPATLLELRAS